MNASYRLFLLWCEACVNSPPQMGLVLTQKAGMLRENGAIFMPDDKENAQVPDDTGANQRKAELLRQIQQEMDTMTPEELERLYAAIALMDFDLDA